MQHNSAWCPLSAALTNKHCRSRLHSERRIEVCAASTTKCLCVQKFVAQVVKSHLPPCNFSHSCNKLCNMPMAVSNKAQKAPTGSGHINKGRASFNVLIIAVKVKAAEATCTIRACAENVAV